MAWPLFCHCWYQAKQRVMGEGGGILKHKLIYFKAKPPYLFSTPQTTVLFFCCLYKKQFLVVFILLNRILVPNSPNTTHQSDVFIFFASKGPPFEMCFELGHHHSPETRAFSKLIKPTKVNIQM